MSVHVHVHVYSLPLVMSQTVVSVWNVCERCIFVIAVDLAPGGYDDRCVMHRSGSVFELQLLLQAEVASATRSLTIFLIVIGLCENAR